MNIIKFTHLDWFRFHGKQYIVKLLEQEGFYDITIRRKMSLEEKCSYIRIAGIYLSKEEGAVYGWANIHADEIFCEDNIAGQQIVQTINNAVYYNDFVDKKNRRSKKESYLNYKIIK